MHEAPMQAALFHRAERLHGSIPAHRARRFGISSDECTSRISLQDRPYDSYSRKGPAGPFPILIIDWSSVQVLLGSPFLLSVQAQRKSSFYLSVFSKNTTVPQH